MKYYHPAVAAGQRNWDAELLRLLPPALACRTVAARSRLLARWLADLGPVAACAVCQTRPPSPVVRPPDLRWMADAQRFSAPLRRQLAYLQANRYQGTPYYVAPGNGASPAFPHEEAYASPALPSPALRVLAVCRYWNMIHYFYPYTYAIGEEWPGVLTEFVPLFAGAATPLAYRRTVLALAARLHDGHATLRSDAVLEAATGEYIVTAALQFIDEQAVVLRVRHDGLVPPIPLEPGDVITHVDGTAVADLVRQRLPQTPGSNRAAQLQTIARELLFGTTEQVTMRLLRHDKALTVEVPRLKYSALPPVRPVVADSMYRFLAPGVGYIDMARLTKEKLPLVMQAFRRTSGIVVDLRNYPREFLPYQLAGYFLPKPAPFVSLARFDPSYPGRFLAVPADSLLLEPGTAAPYTGQLVVLVNETSMSLAEFTAMALRATPRCLIVGSPTAGADGDVTRIVLPGGLTTAVSGTGVYYPDGRETQRVGIVPDVLLRPTPAGIRAGRDELRDQAVEIIRRQPPPRSH
ncbi:S41 family peptidase [Hymenobacter aquaticus]|uniref:S41 family peptidase n=1 Tax=Hymenobacter aquaticus TaxID=1867101 RepID=UPI0014368A07|nr:S41 family peptidase [Hymenobacter aquaticus]